MQALYRYIGPDIDVPAGDMGVGGREIGFLFGEYRRLKGNFENGVLTGKGFSYGGSSFVRKQRAAALFTTSKTSSAMTARISRQNDRSCRLRQRYLGHLQKAAELGAKVVTLSGPDGYIYDPDGVVTEEDQLPPRNA